MAADEMIRIRPYLSEDRGQVMALASRLSTRRRAFCEEEVQLTKAIRPGARPVPGEAGA
ncbi:MAG TPA: hypothetical protein VMU94_16330 [Streptosporangiaceae bacterium]|nr:hypothetical protein [Streptosporangiaceae bacterium]